MLGAVLAVLGGAFCPQGAGLLLRNVAVLPRERVPAAGSSLGSCAMATRARPGVTFLSPLRYHYQHRAEVEAVVQSATDRDFAAFDALV